MRYYLRELIAEKARSTGEEINLEHISENTKLSVSVLRRIHANTEYYTSLKTLEKLVDYFGCDLEDLVKLRPGDGPAKERAKLDAIMDIVTGIRSDLGSLMNSHQISLGREQYEEANASESSFGNAIEKAIRWVLSESTLDGIKNKLSFMSRQSSLPVHRIPLHFFMPLEVYGDKLRDRYFRREIDDVDEARKIFEGFLTARSIEREAICKNLMDILTKTKEPASYEDLVIITGGFSSVVEMVLRYLIANQIEPTIVISLGAEGATTQYEGILLWRRLKTIGYEKAYVIGPHEFTRNAFKDAIHRFLREFVAQGDDGYDVRSIFGYEGARWNGLSVITSKEFEVALDGLELLRASRDVDLNLRTYFVGEAHKIMNPGEDICFEMDQKYICPVPCSMIDHFVTEHAAHAKESADRFEINCCKEDWKRILETVWKSLEIR